MARVFDFSKVTKGVKIYGFVQVFLVILLVFMAVYFQGGLQAEERPERFLHSVIVSVVIQFILFYFLKRFAASDVERDVESAASDLTLEDIKKLRQKRIYSDYFKSAFVLFYFTFAYLAPNDRFVLSIIFISFILTLITYFQCYNFLAKKALKEKLPSQ
jgi:hypothetical protein